MEKRKKHESNRRPLLGVYSQWYALASNCIARPVIQLPSGLRPGNCARNLKRPDPSKSGCYSPTSNCADKMLVARQMPLSCLESNKTTLKTQEDVVRQRTKLEHVPTEVIGLVRRPCWFRSAQNPDISQSAFVFCAGSESSPCTRVGRCWCFGIFVAADTCVCFLSFENCKMASSVVRMYRLWY